MAFALVVRCVALVALVGLFIADFGFQAMARDVSGEVYLLLLAVVLVDNPKNLSELIVTVVKRALNVNGEKK